MQSEQINELAAALAIAQGQITGALKDSQNPFYKSRYADLASVWDACRDHLSANGLCVIQTTESVSEGQITLVTTLAHKSGQFVRGVMSMTPKDSTPQAAGSCLTYLRRYALAAIVGVAQIDDDANAASGKEANGKGIGHHDPRGEAWKKSDTKAVKEIQARIMQAVETSNDDEVLTAWNEACEDHDFGIAVWAVLPKPIQNRIKDLKDAA